MLKTLFLENWFARIGNELGALNACKTSYPPGLGTEKYDLKVAVTMKLGFFNPLIGR